MKMGRNSLQKIYCATKKPMRQFTFALGGGEAQMKKNVTTTEQYGQKLQQVTLTHDIHAKQVKGM